MIDTFLALVPIHGLWIVALAALLACLAVPVPASMLVMAAGGFAAAGDLQFQQLVLAASTGFIMGDQILYALARRGGRPLVERLQCRPRIGALLDSAGSLIQRYGVLAVFVSRTVLSPLGASVGLLSGAFELSWIRFSLAAVPAGIVWASAYSALGYTFSSRIAEIATLIGDSVGLMLAGTEVVVVLLWLVKAIRSDLRRNGSP